jgi:hypothetical protein
MTPWAVAVEPRSGAAQAPPREDYAVTGRRRKHGLAELAGDVVAEVVPGGLWPVLLIGLIGWLIVRLFQRAEVVR